MFSLTPAEILFFLSRKTTIYARHDPKDFLLFVAVHERKKKSIGVVLNRLNIMNLKEV